MKAGIEWMCCSFDSFRVCLKSIFQPTFPPMKAGLSDVLLLCDSFLCVCLSIFQQSHFYPMKAGLSDVLPLIPLWFLRVFFNSPTHFTYESRD
jgi:hypothetical protein